MAILLTEDPTSVNDLSPRYEVGALYEYFHPQYGRGYYRYYRALDAVTYVAGHLCEYADGLGLGVTNDRAGGSSIGRCPAGFACAVFTQNYFGFFQVGGIGITPLLTDQGISAGEGVTPHATTDGACETCGTGIEHQQAAVSMVDDSTAAVAAGSWICRIM